MLFLPNNQALQFKKIIGQKEVRKRLIRTVSEQRISHAQLFFGPEGSGKLALAIAYAQYLNCKNHQDEDSCGECPSCNKYEKLIHPDLHFIYPVAATKDVPSKPVSINFLPSWREFLLKNNYYVSLNDWYNEIGIEKKQGLINVYDCSEIIKALAYKSYEAEYKVMIIWMVEKLFHAAAPKILKILEEPPDKTLFILLTENHDQILPTILSRTQLVKIPKISDHDLLEALKLKFNLPHKDILKAVNSGDGNLIEAERSLSRTEEEEFNFLQFRRWMRICYRIKYSELMEFIDEIGKLGRESQKNFFLYAMHAVRFSLLSRYQDEVIHKFDAEEGKFISGFSDFIHEQNVQSFIEELNKAFYQIERNANANILFWDLSFKLAGLIHRNGRK